MQSGFVRFRNAKTGPEGAVDLLIRPASVVSLIPIRSSSANGQPEEHTLIGFESGFSFEVKECAEHVEWALSRKPPSAPIRKSPAKFVCHVFIRDEHGVQYILRASGPSIVPRNNPTILCNEELLKFTVTLPCSCIVESFDVERNGEQWQHREFVEGDHEIRRAGDMFVAAVTCGRDEL